VAGSLAELQKISIDMEEIVRPGGFKFKETLMSLDKNPEDGSLRKILGLRWDTEADELKIDIKLNASGKRKGALLGPDAELEDDGFDIALYLHMPVTKRILWHIVQSQYDPLGLLSPFTIQFKLLMRDMANENGATSGWDVTVPVKVADELKQVLLKLPRLRKISFPRSLKPMHDVGDDPILLMFGDGSMEASCALAYVRWEDSDGNA
jgi:hypothetical protein